MKEMKETLKLTETLIWKFRNIVIMVSINLVSIKKIGGF